MSFDEIRSMWEQDGDEHLPLPNELNRLKRVKSPVEKIRSKMRTEFFFFIPAIIVLAFSPKLFFLKRAYDLPFYSIYGFFAMMSIYYFIRFYFFYRRLHAYDLNSKDSLYKLYYDIKVNIEMYRSFNYALIPVLVIIVSMFTVGIVDVTKYMDQQRLLLMGVLFLIASMLIVFGTIEIYLKCVYGRYLKEIGHVLEEFREE